MADVHPLSEAARDHDLSRRAFVRTTVGATAWAVASPLVIVEAAESVIPQTTSEVESPVVKLFHALDGQQRGRICFPFDHPLRTRVQNHWAIVEPTIRDLSQEQQSLCRAIFKALCSDDGHGRFLRQMEEDDGGFENYHVALFGTPEADQPLEWVLTGRHATLRADARRPEGVGLGGPLFFGHGAPCASKREGNVWWDLVEIAQALTKILDNDQLACAFPARIPKNPSRPIPGAGLGLAIAELGPAPKQVVRQLLEALMRPFRRFEVPVIQSCLREPSGLDQLRLSFFKDRGGEPGAHRAGDRTWDCWKLEGPGFAWYFHGHPHVHSWIHFATLTSDV